MSYDEATDWTIEFGDARVRVRGTRAEVRELARSQYVGGTVVPADEADEYVSLTALRHGAHFADVRERVLWMRVFDLGNEVDAASDGALHHAHGDRADAMVRALNHRYYEATSALAEYRRAKAGA